MRTQSSFIILALIATSALLVTAQIPNTGGWTPIPDVFDPKVQEIAKFAVSEYNKLSGSSLTYLRVIRGETQVVAGRNYHLFVLAIDQKRSVNTYDALVWEKLDSTKQLTSFKL